MDIKLTHEQMVKVVAEDLKQSIKDVKDQKQDDETLVHLLAAAKYYHEPKDWPMLDKLAYGK